jgi:hypothetical protein
VRWLYYGMAGAVLIWVLGTAYIQARRRGRNIGLALLFLAAAALLFTTAVVPQSTVVSQVMVISSIVLLALAMGVVLYHGFRR